MSSIYIVAVRRDRRHKVPADWIERFHSLEGVRVLGASGIRAEVLVDEDSIDNLIIALGPDFLVEPIIQHRPASI